MKLKYLSILLIISLPLCSSCLKKKKIRGKEYIPKEVLVDVLVDIHLMDGVMEDRKYYRRYNFNDSLDMMTPIFEKYHVTREMFDSTMAEYSRHADLLDKVYDEVIMKLNVRLDDLDKKSEENKNDDESYEKLPERLLPDRDN